MTSAAELATLRLCERDDCDFKVPNVVAEFKDILTVMANHLAAMHPVSGSEGGGGKVNVVSTTEPAASDIPDVVAASNTPAVAALNSG